MAILGNSDIIVLPDNVNPNTHPDYTELLGSQVQLLAVNENASHLWVFNTSSNLWEKINFLTENIGDGIEIYNDENTDDSYREVRTFNPGDKSIRIHQRDDILDFRFGGHSFSTFKHTLSGMYEKSIVISNNFDYKTEDSDNQLKITSVDTINKTFTTNLNNIYKIDFNPLKTGEKWNIYSFTEAQNSVQYLGWKIDKYNNGVFHYTKVDIPAMPQNPNDPSVNQVIYLSSPALNYKGNNNNIFSIIDSNLSPLQTYDGYVINHIYVLKLIKIKDKYILFVVLQSSNLNHKYFTYYYSYNGNTWTIENNYIDKLDETQNIYGIPTSNIFKCNIFRDNYMEDKIFIIYYNNSNTQYYKILNNNLTLYQNYNTFILNGYLNIYSSIFKYKGKLYLREYINNVGMRLLKIDATLKNIIQNNYNYTYVEDIEVNNSCNQPIFKEVILSPINVNNGYWNDNKKFPSIVALYNILSNKFRTIYNNNIISKSSISEHLCFSDLSKYQIANLPNKLTYSFIEKINNKYVIISSSSLSNGDNTAPTIFLLRDFSKTTIKKEIKDYIKFENSENILTYNQGNQIIVEFWNNTTVNLLKIKDWIGEDFVILNPTGYTITINPSSGETIDGNNSISTTDAKIILRSIGNNKIIKYNK